nr:hypothetical protein [Tanacetum cinerariifolium]
PLALRVGGDKRRNRAWPRQPAGAAHHRDAELTAGKRHTGIGFVQRRYRGAQNPHRSSVHRGGLAVHQPQQPRALPHSGRCRGEKRRRRSRPYLRRLFQARLGRHYRWRGHCVLRLHRFRCREHGRAGSQKPQTRHAHRYSGLAGYLHGALHPIRARADWRGQLARICRPRPGRRSFGGLRHSGAHARLRLAGYGRHGRYFAGFHFGYPRNAHGPEPRVLLDGQGRPHAQSLLGAAPQVQHALQVEPHAYGIRGLVCGLRTWLTGRRPHLIRHAAGLRAGEHRRVDYA